MKGWRGQRYCGKFGFKMKNIIHAAFLTMMLDKPMYGYLLVERLNEFGIQSRFVPYGAAYRILREMEMAGLVTSTWETAGSGPARRVYYITEAGKAFLRNWVREARQNLLVIENLINKIEEKLGGAK